MKKRVIFIKKKKKKLKKWKIRGNETKMKINTTLSNKAQAGFQIWILLVSIVAFAFVMQIPSINAIDDLETRELDLINDLILEGYLQEGQTLKSLDNDLMEEIPDVYLEDIEKILSEKELMGQELTEPAKLEIPSGRVNALAGLRTAQYGQEETNFIDSLVGQNKLEAGQSLYDMTSEQLAKLDSEELKLVDKYAPFVEQEIFPEITDSNTLTAKETKGLHGVYDEEFDRVAYENEDGSFAGWGPEGGERTLGAKFQSFGGSVLTAVKHATVVGGFVGMIAGATKGAEEGKAVGISAGIGIFAGEAAASIAKEFFDAGKGTSIGVGIAVGALAALYAYKVLHKDSKEKTIEFKCMEWQAPSGGNECDKCNDDEDRPCSEYRCKSLGQSCGIINAGTGDEKCIWMNPRDVTSPGIKADDSNLTNGYAYENVKDRPPASDAPSGMELVKEGGGCLDAFSEVTFSVETTEPAQCKVDYKHTENYDAMANYLGDENNFVEKHSQSLSLPGTALLNKLFPEVENDGEYSLYIRCKDGNGNENEDEYVVNLCIDKGPDLTPPTIKGTSIINGNPVKYNVDNTTLEVYVNEPGECKWDRSDAGFSNMANDMSCSSNVLEMNVELVYTCRTTLTGIEDRTDNNFFFRCKDLEDNEMRQGYEFKLVGTQPLTILESSPNKTIGGSTTTVKVDLEVKTDNGHNNGDSNCFYSDSGDEGTFLEFFETGESTHKQELDLIEGDYSYYYRCIDLGGNIAEDSVSFGVSVDNEGPLAVRAYYENEKIKIVTNEESDCVYSSESCNYEFVEGIPMPFEDSKDHYAEWRTGQNYYVKCSDEYNNQPGPDSCSIIVRPSPVI